MTPRMMLPHRSLSSAAGRARLARWVPATLLVLGTAVVAPALLPVETAAQTPEDPSLFWPEPQRAFLHDGPGLLLTDSQREELLSLDEEGRTRFIEDFLADPDPTTPENELREAIARRKRLVQQEFSSPSDIRAQVLFLNGRPDRRLPVECGMAFVPLEIWIYRDPDAEIPEPKEETVETTGEEPGEGTGEAASDASEDSLLNATPEKLAKRKELPGRALVFYEPSPGEPWRLWLPLDSKRALYTSEMEYWLEDWEELQGRMFRAKRFDLQVCDTAPLVDLATGVRALRDFQQDRPTQADYERFVQPPEDLAAWARKALHTQIEPPPPELAIQDVEIQFPQKLGERMVTRALITLPPGGFGVDTEGDEPKVRFSVNGVIEEDGKVFDDFRLRFELDPPSEGTPLALAVDRELRPGREFLIRMTVRDDVTEAEAQVVRGFVVATEAQKLDLPEPDLQQMVLAVGEELARQRIPGADSLILVPPESDVVIGLWRAEALVTGDTIQKVVFLVDGTPQLSRTSPPWTAELRLNEFPTEQIVQVEGYGADGELVASDEVVLNQPRGAFRVSIVEPPRGGGRVDGEVTTRAEVVVPEDRRVEKVEFRLNDELVATLDKPPWQTRVVVDGSAEMSYVAATAYLDDGRRAEDVRFLNAPKYLERVDVNLVELYTAVTDRNGRLQPNLTQNDFQVFEDGRPQQIVKFELVRNLPLTVGITIDTSGSMVQSIGEAKRAAVAFLENVIERGDKTFAVGFSNRAELLMPPTDDIEAVEDVLEKLQAIGWTALHDAIVTSLYYFRGVRGQRALVLLSDGDDTSSSIGFREALEYARRSGVAIYPIGLDVGRLDLGVRNKLRSLAEETGGQAFFISKAEELQGVYDQIETELRSRYLLAYNSDSESDENKGFREVEVKVDKHGLKARTIRGYYP
jgi:Ca-activated chloride channel family protein